MKINFILPCIEVCGGIKVVFEYANHLQKRGHKVSVVYSSLPMGSMFSHRKWYDFYSMVTKVLNIIRGLKPGNKPVNQLSWFDLKANLIKVPTFAERHIPDADIVVATWWETAYWVSKYSSKKGKKFYLIQHYEIWGGPKDKVEETYKMGLSNIVISGWLKNVIEKLGAKVESLILNGINFQEFYPEKIKRTGNKFRILIPYRREEWKGIKDGIKAFEIAKNQYPNLQLSMFGPKPRENEIPNDVEFHLLPVINELRRIYNSSDIFVFPSHCEGFGLPPMEAMACKRAVVTTNVGAVPHYTISGETALVSEPKDVKRLAQNIIELIENKTKREQIAEKGYNYIKQFSWDESTDKLERIFKKYIGE